MLSVGTRAWLSNASSMGNGAALVNNTIACPDGNVLASVTAGWASGGIQPYQDVPVNGCMGH